MGSLVTKILFSLACTLLISLSAPAQNNIHTKKLSYEYLPSSSVKSRPTIKTNLENSKQLNTKWSSTQSNR